MTCAGTPLSPSFAPYVDMSLWPQFPMGQAAATAGLRRVTLGFIVSGALLTEIVFSYPGLGFLLYNSVENVDYPLIQGLLLIITIGVLAANFLVDLVYVFLDPTVRRP